VYCGKELHNLLEATLKDIGIVNNSVIFLHLRPRGGGDFNDKNKPLKWQHIYDSLVEVISYFNGKKPLSLNHEKMEELYGETINHYFSETLGEEADIINPDLNSINSIPVFSQDGVNDFIMQLLDIKASRILKRSHHSQP